MKRPLILITVGYITGILWGLYLKINIVPIIFLLLGGVIWKYKKCKLYIVIAIILAFISNTQIKILEQKYKILYLDVENETFTGIIISNQEQGEYKDNYIVKIENINGNIKYKNTKLKLYVDNGIQLKYGQKISFTRRI